MTDKKRYHYELISWSPDKEVLGRCWWDGEKVQTDTELVRNMLSDMTVSGYGIEDGLPFLQFLPHSMRSYVQVKVIR